MTSFCVQLEINLRDKGNSEGECVRYLGIREKEGKREKHQIWSVLRVIKTYTKVTHALLLTIAIVFLVDFLTECKMTSCPSVLA